MNIDKLNHVKALLRKGCMDDIYKPVLDFVIDKLLVLYDMNTMLYTSDFVLQKLCNIDYIISLLPAQRYPLHEYELVLMGTLADISICFPHYDRRTHYKDSADIAEREFGDYLKRFVSDISFFKKTIKEIPFSNKALVNVHHGAGLNGMVLHDVDYLTKVQLFPLVAMYYYNYNYEGESTADKSFTKAYLDCKTRYGQNGTEGLFIKSLGNVHYYNQSITELKEALTTEEKFIEYLNLQEKGEP